MWALILDGRVVQAADEQFEVNPSLIWVECPAGTAVGTLWDGATFSSPAAPQSAPSQIITGAAFLDLWQPVEVAAAWAADPRLMAGALRAAAQNTVNLASPELAGLLQLAVTKGALTSQRAAQIAANQPPPAS